MKREYNEKKLHSYIRDNHLETYMSADIFSLSELLVFDKNEYLVQAGYPAKYLCFLVHGDVIISSCTSADKRTCISYCHPFTIIGEAASLWQMAPSRSVKAMTRCICIGINLTKHRQLLLNDLLFLQNICQILTCKLNADNELSQTLSEPLEVRLSRFILEYSVNRIFTFQLTNCADILNTSYRHLLRMLKCFCAMEVIQKARNCYVIVDERRLGDIANGTVAPILSDPRSRPDAGPPPDPRQNLQSPHKRH